MIDPDLIPESTDMDLARILYRGAKKFYQDPENVKAYEKWAEERRKEKENG